MGEPPVDRRTRKRLQTRQAISDIATRLFFERGFDRVTIDEIAEAADIGRMTVFNHFPRKEDMFFDREQEVREVALAAIANRDAGTPPAAALQALAHQLIQAPHPSFPLFSDTHSFVETALASEALKARARQMRDDFVQALAGALAGAIEAPTDDPNAYLAAEMIAAIWKAAFLQAHQTFGRSHDQDAASRIFLDLIDRGATGVEAALRETGYA